MTDHLAVELRGIIQDADDTDAHPVIRERLLRLVEHVERLGSEPAETTQTTDELDLDVFAPAAETTEPGCCSRPPLTPEQEIRSDALGHAIDSVTRYPGAEWNTTVLDIAETFAGWIRTGQRPGSPPACTCTPIPGKPTVREADPQCPQHGQPA